MNATPILQKLHPIGWFIIASLLVTQNIVAQEYSPASLAKGATITFLSTVNDSNNGVHTESSSLLIKSATTFEGGTYHYTRTGANTATLGYTANFSEPGYSETETGSIQITFTNYGVGQFTNSGNYSGNEGGTPFNGTFTSTGTFTYNGPFISNITDKVTFEGMPTGAIPFTVGDSQTAAGALTVTYSSSNTSLVPLGNIVLGGSGSNRTVTITPAANQSGTATITLTVSDGSLAASDTFNITVGAAQTITSWRLANFSSPDNSGDGADLNDFDKDGLSNLLEFAFGTDPKEASSSYSPVITIEEYASGPHLTLAINKPSGITGVTYVVEVSDNLVNWSSGSAHTTVVSDISAFLKVRDNTPASGGMRFIRLKVTVVP